MGWCITIAILLNIILAYYDAYRIKKNIRIKHGWNAAIYLTLCVLIAVLFENVLFAVPMLFIRPVVFDPLLNVLRDKPLFYVSKTTTSVIDRLERKISKDGQVHWFIWFGLTILSVFIIRIL